MKTSLSILIIMVFCLSANGQSVGINIANPDPSAALEVHSYDQGILVPRLKTTSIMSIQNPATGLLVYDLNKNRFFQYNGTDWIGISTTDAFINESGVVRNDGDLGNDILLFAADQLPGLGSIDTLLMFHTPTGSFRVGRPASNYWVVDSLGSFSFAAGAGVKASGDYSASIGTANQSIGDASFTAGIGNEASDSYATAIGRMNEATGFGALATGSENLASGQYSTAMGNLTEASGGTSTAMGSQTKAIGGQSTAMGIQSEAIGTYSTAMGRTTKAESYNSIAMGRFNVGGGHPGIWQDGDPLFEVGIGSDASNLQNAMTILKNGTVKFKDYTFPNQDGTVDQVLSTDGSGQLFWKNGVGVFENNNGVVRNSGSADDDFVFGMDSLPNNTTKYTESLFFFDEGKSAFRAGRLNNSRNWAADSIGFSSFAVGYNSKAKGQSSVSIGYDNKAHAPYGIAIGFGNEATGDFGTAMGLGTDAESYAGMSIGRLNVGGGDRENWVLTDPVFEIGIGTHSVTDRRNAMTVLKNGKTGIGTATPDESLSVIGKVRAAMDGDENEFTEIFHGGGNGFINTVGDGNLDFRHDDDTKMSLTDSGNLYVDGQLTLGNANASNNYTFPGVDGSTDQYLQTNGKGNLSWVDITTSPFTDNGQSVIPTNGSLSDNFMVGGNAVPGMNTTEKMIYYNDDNNALRHGYINQSDEWDASNLGEGSFATGYNVLASGNYSVAIGDRTDATGNASFASGENTESTGLRSASFGNNTTASGENAFAIGRTGNASGWNSFKSGFNTFANGDNSATFGVGNTAHGFASVAAGDGNIVNARSSMALGTGLVTNSYGCFAIGAFNEGFGNNPDTWVGSTLESIFEVGIGNALNRENALTISQMGSIGIGTAAGISKLTVNENHYLRPLLRLSRNNDPFLTIGVWDSITIYKEVIMEDRMDFWPQVDQLVQYRLELPNIATIEDGTAVAYNWHTYSDRRVKKQIEESPYGLDAVLALNPVKYHHHSTDYENGFKLREDYTEEIGFIAQEAYEVIKEVVNKPEDESKALWTMNYEKLTPVLVKAIQEQQAIIESLKEQLSEKDTEMKSLRSDVDKLFKMMKANN